MKCVWLECRVYTQSNGTPGTWRPMLPVIEDQPLALRDPRTTAPDDLVDRLVINKLGEVYLMKYRPKQQWYCLISQKDSEPFLFLTWDSKSGGQPRCKCPHLHIRLEEEIMYVVCPHTSFSVPVGPDIPPRESVETHSIVISRL
jgi:hypothetical protein